MDDVWISGRLAVAGVPRSVPVLATATLRASPPLSPFLSRHDHRRYVVPFDEDQFTMSPNLENVTTLDHVSLKEKAPGGGGGRKRVSSSGGNTRTVANEQALQHFRDDWDVIWDGSNYEIKRQEKR